MPHWPADVLEEICAEQHLDDAVDEVFRMMLGAECRPINTMPEPEADTLTAMVGLAGVLGGVCVLRGGRRAILHIAEALAGTPFLEIDATVKDAIGEVTNMLAGARKSRVKELSSGCMLSVPAIVTGRDYRVHLQDPKLRIARIYRFGDSCFTFDILIESL